MDGDQVGPRVISELSTYVVRQVATSAGGRHAMAVTADGKLFSWGDGEFGQLGHGDNKCANFFIHISFMKLFLSCYHMHTLAYGFISLSLSLGVTKHLK